MLKLINISKQYKTDSFTVDALKNINISFRENEFVSILGPSGCGKTTLLNIIGGLDRYSDGDLHIDGLSTKKYKDRDWDNYRNKRIGFIFQSYNLIPHLSILGNVELSLTISGVGKRERRQRAIEVLKKVGLESEIKKKPNQLSGGQMQRVAIARALVNNPEILLADEPTGALDIKTSIEIMDLIKEISKNCLVIMVTHNGELAEKYSTRIIKLLDGCIINDNNPYEYKNENKEDVCECHEKKQEELSKNIKEIKQNKIKHKKSSSMNFLTALSLSFKNLISKKGRTIATAFAGSIGIVGIALVLAISNGLTGYINKIQSEALGGYPITVSSITIDMNAFTSFNINDDLGEYDKNSIVPYNPAMQFVKYGHYNNITTDFIDYVKKFEEQDSLKGENKQINLIEYSYFTPLKILHKNLDNTVNLFTSSNSTSILSGGISDVFFPMLKDIDFVMSQYDLIYGEMPEKNQDEEYTHEMLLVVGEGNKLPTDILMALGIEPKIENGEYVNIDFETICSQEFKLIFNDDYYIPNSENFEEITSFDKITNEDQAKLMELYENSNDIIKISGIIRIKDDAPASLLSTGVAYMPDLGEYYLNNCKESLIAKKQLENKDSYTFYDNYVINISEFSDIVSSLLPEGGFSSVEQINNFLMYAYGYTLDKDQAFDLAMQQIGISTTPTGIYFYPKNFEAKDSIIKMINEYNDNISNENQKIVYLDSTGFLTDTLGKIISIISYVLIGFASISLVVSSIMIGIITYVSVIERTKEIGVLRSLGARKLDIVSVFNSETFIIGLVAGLLGGIISAILTIPINLIISSFSPEIGSIAVLKISHVLILTILSIVLSLISGLIPARIASKKDPVVALRSE